MSDPTPLLDDSELLRPGDARFEAILDERARELASRDQRVSRDDSSHSHLLFEAGGVRFAVPSSNVVRVVRDPRVARIPGAPRKLRHVLHADGRVTSITDPVSFVAAESPTVRAAVVLLERSGRRIGLFADAFAGLEALDVSALVTRTSSEPDARSVIAGTTASIVVVLDVDALTDPSPDTFV